MKTSAIFLSAIVCLLAVACTREPLPSWRESASKQAIVAFVNEITTPGSAHFVPPQERVAVFDNDGTLWSEQPIYFQLQFILDRIEQLAPQNPGWHEREPFASILSGDPGGALAGGEQALFELFVATHAGVTASEFRQIVIDWMADARHPTSGRPYTEMVFQPMLEMLDYLQANDFKTYIVSGGGIDFMRPWVQDIYGIPPEQVVGSMIETEYRYVQGKPVLARLPELEFLNDKSGKPVGIHRHIGRRPLLAFGNSDGDFEMLEWTTSGARPGLGVIIHHTDGEREWAYDRDSHIGRLARGLDEGPGRGWVIVDMKADWQSIFP